MAIIRKSDVVLGINNVEKVKIESLNGEMYLRPLSSAELDEINYIEAEGMGNLEQNNRTRQQSMKNSELTQTNKLNVLKLTKASDKAKYMMIEKGLDNPKYQDDPWEIEDIKQLPRNAVNEIHRKIQILSGLDVTENDVKNFPEIE